MQIHLDQIQDKIECFQATTLKELEKKMNEQIENNKVLLLEVANIQYQVYADPKTSFPLFTAIVHFKAKK